MATGASATRANAAIDDTVALGTWIKLHTGSPGAAGTSNAATETTRKQATFAAAASGIAATTGDLIWTSVAASETYTYFSMWTASSGGTFLWSGTITGTAVTIGGTWTMPAGGLTLVVTAAS
jgi:hypothetical protein